MKRYLGLALFLCASTCGLYAQVTDTTVCDVLKSPQSFDGKMVRIKGTVIADFDQFVIHAEDCGQYANGIWISYPQGTKGKAGPEAMVVVQPAKNYGGTAAPARTPVTLDKSKDFKTFDNLLSQVHNKGTGMCLGCGENQVSATLVGRLDGVSETDLRRDASGKLTGLGGFGNLNGYPARLVLQSVSDVSSKPADYSKSDALTKGDSDSARPSDQDRPEMGVIDPFATAATLVKALAGNPLGDQIQKAISVYPKPKTPPTNVSYGYGTLNEVAANDGTPGAQDSPDGALYICTFNKDRIKPEALTMAFIHMGQHVVDLETPLKGNEEAPPFIMEYNAWVVTTESAISYGDKFVTLPGGYLMWNSKWPQAEQVNDMGAALQGYLGTEAMLSK